MKDRVTNTPTMDSDRARMMGVETREVWSNEAINLGSWKRHKRMKLEVMRVATNLKQEVMRVETREVWSKEEMNLRSWKLHKRMTTEMKIKEKRWGKKRLLDWCVND